MTKFLRKHAKWIMVIGGSLLMVSFLVPQAIQQFGSNPGSAVVARLDGRDLTAEELRQATMELERLRTLAPGVVHNFLGVQPNDTVHWLLLKREAQAGGFIADGAGGEEWIPELAELEAFLRLPPNLRGLAQQVFTNPQWRQVFNVATPDDVRTALETQHAMAAQSGDWTLRQFRGALADLRGVVRLIEAYNVAPRLSGRRALVEGRRAHDGMFVEYVFLPADLATAGVAEPDEAALREHYERFKGVRPSEGEFGFGYLDPARVKLAWLTLDRSAIEEAIEPDLIEVNRRWRQDKAKYGESFEGARARIEAEIRAERAERIMADADRIIQAEVLKATRRLESDGPYLVLPEDWDERRPRFEQIAQAVVDQVREAHGVSIPLPEVTVHAAGWLTRDEVRALPGIGQSRLSRGGMEVAFDQLVFSVRGLGNEGRVPVQAGVPMVETPLSDMMGRRYYLTILAAVPESAPPFEEIRDRVAADYRRLHAYEALLERTGEFEQLAAAEGLQAVVEAVAPDADASPAGEEDAADASDEDLDGEGAEEPTRPVVKERVRVTRSAAGAAELNAEAVREAIADAAARLDPLTPPERLDPAAATVVVPAPGQLGVVVARIVALSPLTAEQFRGGNQQLVASVRGREFAEAGGNFAVAFSSERLRRRHNYVELTGEDEEVPPAEDAAEDGGGQA